MSLLSKLFGLVMVFGLSLGSINALGMTSSASDTLYSESITLQRSSAEIPTSIGNSDDEISNPDSDAIDSLENTDSLNQQKTGSNKNKKTI